jgi:tRNA(fMet)-specific endonuclease VapC
MPVTLLMPGTLLDTDTLSAIMRRHPTAMVPSQAVLVDQHRLAFSIITRYDVLRGLHAKSATAQLIAFDRLCASSEIVPMTDSVVTSAAEVYADL